MPHWDGVALVEHAGRWERWTIDEILDDRVRLLVCQARAGMELLEEALVLQPGETRVDRARVTEAAMSVELARADEMWEDEIAAIVDQADLTRLLQQRMTDLGLPGARNLREGDVFFVFVPGDAGVTRWSEAPAGALGSVAAASAATLESVTASGAVVLDLSAAARQAMKRIYQRAGQASSLAPEV